jgi:hypothetical protein
VNETPLHLIRTNRFLPAGVERAMNSALSRGPGYEPTPLGTAFDGRTVNGYYTDYRAKTVAPIAHDLASLPPAPLMQHALGWWERHVHGEAQALDEFVRTCDAIEGRALGVDGELHWPIGVPVPKYRLLPPWRSALPQAQAASAFVRAYVATGDERYEDLAVRAASPLIAETDSGLVTQTASGPILEEAPCQPPSHILNGWMTALWSLWDLHVGLGHAAAGAAFQAGIICLRANLSAYDTGRWSLYSLFPHALEDLAKPIYHRLHVDQLEVCYRLSGCDEFKEVATRWAAYDRRMNVSRAVAQKAMFSLVDGRRRRVAAR